MRIDQEAREDPQGQRRRPHPSHPGHSSPDRPGLPHLPGTPKLEALVETGCQSDPLYDFTSPTASATPPAGDRHGPAGAGLLRDPPDVYRRRPPPGRQRQPDPGGTALAGQRLERPGAGKLLPGRRLRRGSVEDHALQPRGGRPARADAGGASRGHRGPGSAPGGRLPLAADPGACQHVSVRLLARSGPQCPEGRCRQSGPAPGRRPAAGPHPGPVPGHRGSAHGRADRLRRRNPRHRGTGPQGRGGSRRRGLLDGSRLAGRADGHLGCRRDHAAQVDLFEPKLRDSIVSHARY